MKQIETLNKDKQKHKTTLENFESNPKSILLFTNLIERLRGCCRAVISDTNIVVDFCSLYFSSLIDLMPRFVGYVLHTSQTNKEKTQKETTNKQTHKLSNKQYNNKANKQTQLKFFQTSIDILM